MIFIVFEGLIFLSFLWPVFPCFSAGKVYNHIGFVSLAEERRGALRRKRGFSSITQVEGYPKRIFLRLRILRGLARKNFTSDICFAGADQQGDDNGEVIFNRQSWYKDGEL